RGEIAWAQSSGSGLACVGFKTVNESSCSSEQFASSEVADEAAISGEEIVARQVAETTPAHIVEDVIGDFAFEMVNGEELQIDRTAIAVGMPYMSDSGSDGGGNTKFFFEFANERFFRAFAGFHFAAGELPLECHCLIRPALTYKHFVAAE